MRPLRAEVEADDGTLLRKDGLKILDIGNSYTDDAVNLLPSIAQASSTDLSGLCLWTLVRSNGSFRSWANCYEDRDTLREYHLNYRFGDLQVPLANARGEKGDGSLMRKVLASVRTTGHTLSRGWRCRERQYQKGCTSAAGGNM